jgi:SAM-dependent methyltransferase
MTQARAKKRRTGLPYDFLVVDDFLRDLYQARALKTAFELRLVDELLDHPARTLEELEAALGTDRAGLRFLLDLLGSCQIIDTVDGRFRLHARFVKALEFRDLLETKLDFAGFVAADFLELFTGLVAEPRTFMQQSRLFRLFDYQRCFDSSHESYERTRTWMRLTTTLTHYEARACLEHHDFSAYRRMLDVGGNSGEFALQACRRHPGLTATVFDLPLVCEIGQEHILPHPERDHIGFLTGDVRRDALPGGYDLIMFKSMLHDWPEEDAGRIVAQASRALEPGGTLLVFERMPLDLRASLPPFSALPVLLFFRSYRDPGTYRRLFEANGLVDVRFEAIAVDVPFALVTGKKPVDARTVPAS